MFFRANPTGGPFGTPGVAYARKFIGTLLDDSGHTNDELWLTCRAAFTTDALSSWEQNGQSICAFQNANTYLSENETQLEGAKRFFGDWFSGMPAYGIPALPGPPTLVANKWFVFELHFHKGVDRGGIITCESSWSGTSSQTHNEAARSVMIGSWAPSTGFFAEMLYYELSGWVDRVKVGLSRGADDVWSDDFASGDFSAWFSHSNWTGTEGDSSVGYGCTIVDRPAFPDVNPFCTPGEPIATGVHLPPITLPYGSDYVER